MEVLVEKLPAEVWVLHRDADCRGKALGDERAAGGIGIAEYVAAQRGQYLVVFKCGECFPPTGADNQPRWPHPRLRDLIKAGKFIPREVPHVSS